MQTRQFPNQYPLCNPCPCPSRHPLSRPSSPPLPPRSPWVVCRIVQGSSTGLIRVLCCQASVTSFSLDFSTYSSMGKPMNSECFFTRSFKRRSCARSANAKHSRRRRLGGLGVMAGRHLVSLTGQKEIIRCISAAAGETQTSASSRNSDWSSLR